jgi:hypothetical protein
VSNYNFSSFVVADYGFYGHSGAMSVQITRDEAANLYKQGVKMIDKRSSKGNVLDKVENKPIVVAPKAEITPKQTIFSQVSAYIAGRNLVDVAHECSEIHKAGQQTPLRVILNKNHNFQAVYIEVVNALFGWELVKASPAGLFHDYKGYIKAHTVPEEPVDALKVAVDALKDGQYGPVPALDRNELRVYWGIWTRNASLREWTELDRYELRDAIEVWQAYKSCLATIEELEQSEKCLTSAQREVYNRYVAEN